MEYPVLEPRYSGRLRTLRSGATQRLFQTRQEHGSLLQLHGRACRETRDMGQRRAQPGFCRELLGPLGAIFELMKRGLRVSYTARVGLCRRGENDPFSDKVSSTAIVFRLKAFINWPTLFWPRQQ